MNNETNMNNETLTKLQDVAKSTVLSQIGDNKQHGWGIDDSLAVIESVIAEDCEIAGAGTAHTACPSEEAMALIKQFINPSAFRQTIEGKLLAEPVRRDKKASVKLAW